MVLTPAGVNFRADQIHTDFVIGQLGMSATQATDALAVFLKRLDAILNPPLHKLRQRVRRGDLAPMEALSILTTERNVGRNPPPKIWAWVDQRVERATRKGGYGESWIRRGGGR